MIGSTSDITKITAKRIDLNEVDLVVGLFDAYRVFYKKLSDPELAKRFLIERLQNNESVIFVALNNNDEPVGFTQLYPTYSSVRAVKNWILNDLYVTEDHRKQGIASFLIDEVMKFATTTKSQYVQLETAFDNHNAQHLYEQWASPN